MRNYKKDRTMVQVRVQADTPYQVKRVMEAVGKETVIILESVTDDSKKSLSPVRNKSAPTLRAALSIGRSFSSRISFSSWTAKDINKDINILKQYGL